MDQELGRNLRTLGPYGDSDFVVGLAWPAEGTSGGGRPPLPIETLMKAAESGLPIDLYPTRPFDLNDFGAALGSIPRLRWLGDAKHIRGVQALTQMRALTHLHFPAIDGQVDISHLPALTRVVLEGDGMLSALRAPHLTVADVSRVRSWPTSFAISAGMVDFRADGVSLPPDALREAVSLEHLYVEETPSLDLHDLPESTRLRVFVAMRVRDLKGIARLIDHHPLEALFLYRVAQIDDPVSLERADIAKVEIELCDDVDDAFAAKLAGLHPDWYLRPRRKNGTVRPGW